MKQFNVRDETHLLGRELSVKTGKNLLEVVHEGLELYRLSLEAVEAENNILQRAAAVIDERMCQIVHTEVPHAIDEVVRLQEEMQEKQKQELEQLLKEVTPEEPTEADANDLKVVPYDELYSSGVKDEP